MVKWLADFYYQQYVKGWTKDYVVLVTAPRAVLEAVVDIRRWIQS